MYLVSLHGQATSARPSVSGKPTECRPLTKPASCSSMARSTCGADAGHDLHRDHDVGGVGDLDAVHRHVGLDVAHDERDDVHRATGHAPLVEVAHDRLHLGRRLPVVGEAGVLLVLGADEGAVLDAGDVAWGRRRRGSCSACSLRVQAGEGAGLDQLGGQLVPLLVRAVDPVDRGRGGQGSDLVDPGLQACVARARPVVRLGGHGGPSAGLAHWSATDRGAEETAR